MDKESHKQFCDANAPERKRKRTKEKRLETAELRRQLYLEALDDAVADNDKKYCCDDASCVNNCNVNAFKNSLLSLHQPAFINEVD